MIRIKRAYDPREPDDGARFLVDGLWPRGVKKQALELDGWVKEAAPSRDLRRWFGHDPEKWGEFQTRYRAELDGRTETLAPLLEAARTGNITLIYAARDQEHNNAVVLARYLKERLESG